MKKDTVIIDIDGCLNYYPAPLKMWAEVMLHVDRGESKRAIQEKKEFDLLKETYRHNPLLNYLLPREGAQEVCEKIKKNGYLITLLTARNPKKNPEIRTTTRKWLFKYKIPFDSIVFTKDKSAYIKQHESRIIMVVEDEPGFLNSFKKLRTKVAVFKNDFNGDIEWSHFNMVSSWKEVALLFEDLMTQQDLCDTKS